MALEKQCAKCGACLVVCPVYRQNQNEAHTARGKLHLLDVLGLAGHGPFFEEIFASCLLCGACSNTCPRSIDVRQEVITARESFSAVYGKHGYQKFLAGKLLDHPVLLKTMGKIACKVNPVLANTLPADSGLRLRLGIF